MIIRNVKLTFNQQLVAGSLLNNFTPQFSTLSLYEHKDLSNPSSRSRAVKEFNKQEENKSVRKIKSDCSIIRDLL